MSQVALNTIGISALGTGVAAGFGYILYMLKRRDDKRDKLESEVVELRTKIEVMQAKVIPISDAMLAVFVKQLTHTHAPEMDALLAKVPHELTPEDQARLNELCKERSTDMSPEISDDERKAAIIVPTLIKMVQEQAKMPLEEQDVVMVSVPKAPAK